MRCAGEHHAIASDVLVDMLRHSKFDPEEIDREKGVIIEEMNMYFDTPLTTSAASTTTLLYGDQPIGWDIIGAQGDRPKERPERCSSVTSTSWQPPERMVVGVCWQARCRPAWLIIERLLGDLEQPPKQQYTCACAVVAVSRRSTGRRSTPRCSDEAHLCLGVPSYPLAHPDRYALQLLATILGTGMSSRLFTEVRERRGLAYYIYAINHSYTDVGSLFSQAGSRHRADRRGDHDDRAPS